ncbi:MAG: hypothetical protein K8U57_20400 [Planctomycetes bacterium]|nr:hypothetical protein [Planctomycetota bacterium]
MPLVLQRIAIYGTFAALFLALLGVVLGQMASIMIPRSPEIPGAAEAGIPNPDAEILATIQTRTPIMMAVWGFVLVTIGELLLHVWRSRKPAPPPGPTPQERIDTEKVLQELMAKAEAEEKAKSGTGGHRDKGGESQEVVLPELPRKEPPKASS